MVVRHTLIAFVICCAPLAAQEFQFVSPPIAPFVFGNSSSVVMFGSTANRASRTQQCDQNWIGNPLFQLVTSLSLRRDNAANSGAVARTIDVEVTMAHGNFATFSTTFANNYTDVPVTVFPRQTINAPSWVGQPTLDQFDLVIPFQTPWVYNGQESIVWDIYIHSTGAAGAYNNDWYSSVSGGTDYGQTHLDRADGCTTANGVFDAHNVFRSSTTQLTLQFSVTGAPSSSPVTMLVGSLLPVAIPVPGLCAPLGTDALFSIPLGTSDAAGAIANAAISSPFSVTLAGAILSTQAAALDPSQTGIPVALSNSSLTSLPRSAGAPQVGCKRTWIQTTTVGATGSAVTTSAIPVRFAY